MVMRSSIIGGLQREKDSPMVMRPNIIGRIAEWEGFPNGYEV